jgi:hypothetical protein
LSKMFRPEARDFALACNYLVNWIGGNASIARQETAYLTHPPDLINLADRSDSAITRIEWLIEGCAFRLERLVRYLVPDVWAERLKLSGIFNNRASRFVSSDEHIFIAGAGLRTVARLVTSLIATFTLLAPVLLLSHITTAAVQLGVVSVSAAVLLAAVSTFTHAKTVELFTAGAS